MLGRFFRTKSEREKLIDKRKKLLQEAFKLSTIDRKASDRKHAEADALLIQIDKAPA